VHHHCNRRDFAIYNGWRDDRLSAVSALLLFLADSNPFLLLPPRSGGKNLVPEEVQCVDLACIDQNFVFLRGFSENNFACLINRARARMA